MPRKRPQVLGVDLNRSESGCLVAENLYGVSTAPVLTASGAENRLMPHQSRYSSVLNPPLAGAYR
jgi:hypothetical protein